MGRWEGWAVLAGFGGDADEVEGGGGGGTRASKISSVKAIGRDAFFFLAWKAGGRIRLLVWCGKGPLDRALSGEPCPRSSLQ